MKSIYKKIISIGLLSAFFELALVQYAHAGLVGSAIEAIGGIVVMKILSVVLSVISWIAQKIFMLAGMLIELAMRLNNNILDPSSNVFLFKGWTVLVNVADLALVVALIVIAFATMLNSQTYGMKKALPRLIVIALLVNFSLVIPGVFLDISGMVTEFFLQQSGLKGDAISSALSGAFDISGFLSTNNSGSTSIEGFTKITTGIFSTIGSMAFAIIFTLIGAIILGTMAVMLFVRFFILSFLLVLTPLVFVAWIFPATKKHWDKWWNDFVRWTMFPPVMIFFVWLSLMSLNAFKNALPMGQEPGTAAFAFKDGMLFGLSAVIQMAMAVMFMMMSLIAANSISINGAKGGKDMIGTMTNWGKGKIEGWGKGTKAYGQREAERLGRRATAPVTAAIGRRAKELRKYEGERKPGVRGWIAGRTAGALGRAGEKINASQQEGLKNAYEERFKGMSEDNLALRYSTMGADERVFAAQQLAAKGKLNKVNERVLDSDIAANNAETTFNRYGGEKAYEKVTKAAGRNAEMVHAKNGLEEVAKMPAGAAKTDATHTAKKKLEEAADKFYGGFSRKEFEALGSAHYKGAYSEAATKAMLKKEPGAFGKIVAGMDKSKDVQTFNEKAIEMIKSMKQEALAAMKAKGPEMASETDKELLSVMKGMKNFNEQNAKEMKIEQKLQWIRENDARVHAEMGGEKLATSLEQQVKFLIAKKNPIVTGLEDVQNYRKMIETEKSLERNMSKRLYGFSEKDEKKEEKKA